MFLIIDFQKMKSAILFIMLIFLQQIISAQVIKPLGDGLTISGTINKFAIDDQSGDYYAVGIFSGIDGKQIDKVAQRKNGEWIPVSDTSAINGVVYCAEFHNGHLYIGGKFTIESNESIINIAKLVDGVWQPMGIEFMSGSIRDLTWFDGELYVTGDFRGIGGTRNYGVMKYSEEQWVDAGLYSFLNASGFVVSDNTLLAWGSGFRGNGAGYTHTVSIYTDGAWTTLPGVNDESSVSESCAYVGGVIYTTIDDYLYQFDYSINEWKLLGSTSLELNSVELFVHENKLHLVDENSDFYKLQDGALEKINFQGSNNFIEGSIHTASSIGDKILIGGSFQHWVSHSVSLSVIENDRIINHGRVSSNISFVNAFEYSLGQSIVTFNDKYVIGGRFTFADGVYSPNIVYWDGESFTQFEAPLPSRVSQLEVFENELYAVSGGQLWKFEKIQWKNMNSPLPITEINIINDKLFILDEYQYFSLDGGPFYLQNNDWKELKSLPLGGQFSWYSYSNIRSFKGGYLMLVNDKELMFLADETGEWELISELDINVGKVITIENKVFITDKFGDNILEYREEGIDTVAKNIDIDYPFFFKLEEQIYFSAWNGLMYRYNDDQKFEYFNSLRVRDVEYISEGKFLLALQSRFYSAGLERTILNNIGVLSFDELDASLKQDRFNICQQNYIEFWPTTEHISLNYEWEFEGGIPATSAALNPMIKYLRPGTFNATLKVFDNNRDTITLSTFIQVDNCEFSEPRANNFDNYWIMGYEYSSGRGTGGFDYTFPESIIAARYFPPYDFRKGTVVMSDVTGNLQFYSNGISINNMHNLPIKGSDCFNSDLENYPLNYFLSHQSIISLPDNENNGVYHLFDLDPLLIDGEYWSAASNLSKTTIDMTKENGLGEISACNEVLIDDILLNSTMQATRHLNGKDWWIIVGKYQSDEYYKILLTADGVESVETSKWGRFYDSQFNGQSSFSPDGKYFAQVVAENEEVSLWKFNNQTGELYDQQSYTIVAQDDTESPLGCSFSPDSRFLYISSLTQLRQIDLCNYDALEVELIDTWDGSFEFIYPLYFGKQMLDPNQQIVVAPYGNGHFSFGIIESPNEKGASCNFKQHSLSLAENTRNSADVLPTFPHFRTYPSYEGNCENVSAISEEKVQSFYVYPNPISSNNALQLSEKASGTLYDSNGRKIFSFIDSDYLDLLALDSGIYFLETDLGTARFVKL